MKKIVLFISMVALAGTALADSATDSAIRMEETGIAVFGHADYEAPTAAYPTAASGTSADEANASASATSATVSWSLSAWSVGRMISEQPPDAKVGEFLKRFRASRTTSTGMARLRRSALPRRPRRATSRSSAARRT